MTRLLLVRHGESEWNAVGRWQGWADPPLSPQGRAEAAAATQRLNGFRGSIVASDLKRASQTAQIIATRLGLGEVHIEPGLREIDVGAWSGLTMPELEAAHPEEFLAWRERRPFTRTGGEQHEAFRARILEAVGRVVASATTDEVLCVTHGGVIREIERAVDIETSHVPNLGGRWFVAASALRADSERIELVPDHGPEPDAL